MLFQISMRPFASSGTICLWIDSIQIQFRLCLAQTSRYEGLGLNNKFGILQTTLVAYLSKPWTEECERANKSDQVLGCVFRVVLAKNSKNVMFQCKFHPVPFHLLYLKSMVL